MNTEVEEDFRQVLGFAVVLFLLGLAVIVGWTL